MKCRKTLLVCVATLAPPAAAAIVPSWRVNPITPAAVAGDARLAGATSVSLVVALSGDSLFNVAGLTLPWELPGDEMYYNHPFGSIGPPSPALIAAFPAVAFDSYVSGTTGVLNVISGTYSGVPGPSLVGPNRVDATWGASPVSGPLGGVELEIARITFLANVGPLIGPLSPINGEVRDQVRPTQAIAVPHLPTPSRFVPEPICAAATLLLVGRRGRSHGLEEKK